MGVYISKSGYFSLELCKVYLLYSIYCLPSSLFYRTITAFKVFGHLVSQSGQIRAKKKPRSIHPDKISKILGRPSTIRTNLTRWHPDKNPVVGIRHFLGMAGVLINVKTHIHDQRQIQRSASDLQRWLCFRALISFLETF